MARAEREETDDFEAQPRRSNEREKNWETVATGIRIVQVGYCVAFISFAAATILFGPLFCVEWPRALELMPEVDVRERNALLGPTLPPGSLLYYSLCITGLLSGLFLVLFGQACCTTSPRTWGSVLAWAAVMLLLGGVFLQTMQSSLPYLVGRSQVDSGWYERTLIVLRSVALGSNLLSQFLLIGFVKIAASAVRDRRTNRRANVCLAMCSIYFPVTVSVFVLGLLFVSLNARQGNMPQIMRELRDLGTTPMLLFVGWSFLGVLVVLSILVMLQQLRERLLRPARPTAGFSLLPVEEERR
jgi:hypothetical protein